MKFGSLGSLVLFAAMSATAPASYAQQASDTSDAAKAPATAAQSPAPAASRAPAPAASKTAASSDVPAADTLKKAKEAGYHTRVKRGAVYFCKDVVETGTRFKTETCVDENQLAQTLIWEQAQRDQFSNHTCTGCSGK